MTTEPTTPAPPTCGCCTFGNHTEPCTCDGNECCHPQAHRGPAELDAEDARCGRQIIAERGRSITEVAVDEPVPVEIPLDVARTLYAMLGDLLGEHDEPAPSAGRDTMREAIAAIVRRVPGNDRDEYDLTTAVLAVRDGEMERLRAKVARLTSDLAETAGLEETAADRYQNALHWQERAEEAEAEVAKVRAMHKPRTVRHGSGCVQCGIAWPCPTYRTLTAPTALAGQGDGGGK